MSAYLPVSENSGWRTSSLCDAGQCVGVARQGEFIVVGNTGNLEGGVSRFTIQEWNVFVAGVKLGDFDDIEDYSGPAS
jgi:hypothetical protein